MKARSVISLAIVALVMLALFLAVSAIKPGVNKFLYTKRIIGKYSDHISTNRNDRLCIEYRKPSNFSCSLDVRRYANVYCNTCGHALFAWHSESDFTIDKRYLTCIYDTKHMRAYRYSDNVTDIDVVFWISSEHKYCGGMGFGLREIIQRFHRGDTVIRDEFYPFAKSMGMSRRWDYWCEGFADFVVEQGDREGIAMVRRYAAGKFTQEELRINAHTYITRDEVMEYSRELLKKQHDGAPR